ncbi:MAG: ABC transporter ATP-binding protein [Pseudomonadota bacterium]
MSMQLEVDKVSIRYDSDPVVREVSFALPCAGIGCLLGPSGCGKTSLLRAIAGFEPVSTGEIRLSGRAVSTPASTVPPEKRNIGMVFQDFALFPHLSIEKNVGFGLQKWKREEREARVSELLRLVGLEAVRDAYPHQLSGGQQQRIALIRAMAPRPEILLLDEPFSSLDADLREQLAREVRAILKRDGVTAILVTHDHMEAFAMADHIGVLGEQRLRQWDIPYKIYHEPADRFVADFVGQGAILPGTVIDGDRIETELGIVPGEPPSGCGPGSQVNVLLRPDDVIHDDDSPLRLPVAERAFRGAEYLYTLTLPSGGRILCMVQSHHSHALGEKIGIRLDLKHMAVFPA